QKDGSVFVHQSQPFKNDVYTLVFRSELKGIRGLRLEALTDPRLPVSGSGWAADGNFVVSELTLHAAPADGPEKPRAIALRNPTADFSQEGWHVRGAIDGNSSSGWAVGPEASKDHTALFELAEPAGDGRASRLTVRIDQRHSDPQYLLGRFRVSVSEDAA